ncbi:MAG: DUF1569 domain-containing protein [Bacteroidota bacterium]
MNTIDISALKKLLTQLEHAIPDFEKKNLSISNSNIGWHIEHVLMVFNGIIYTTSKSILKDYKWSFNLKRIVVFAKNKIPRGVAKAPKAVVPKEDYSTESLTIHFEKAKSKLEELQYLDPQQFFNHPIFGNLRLKKTIQFLAIHTKHHLDIIEEIKKSEK